MGPIPPEEGLVERLLEIKEPSFGGDIKAFEYFVEEVDTAREIAGEEHVVALNGLRNEAARDIGKKLSRRKRFFFEYGQVIGTNGYSTEQHYLIGEAYLGKQSEGVPARDKLWAQMHDDPGTFLTTGLAIEAASYENVLGADQMNNFLDGLRGFETEALQKTPEEYANWLVGYLHNEEAIRQGIAAGGPLGAYKIFSSNLIFDGIYNRILDSIGGVLNPEADPEYVYQLIQELEKLAASNSGIEDQISNAVVDLARKTTVRLIYDDADLAPMLVRPESDRVVDKLTGISASGTRGRTTRATRLRVMKNPKPGNFPGQQNAMWN